MALKGNQSTARAINRRLVLDQLRRNGPMSRAAIAVAVGLSPAAVTFVTADLIDEGLLIEGRAVAGSSGRRPVPLEINFGSRHSIGLKVMVDRVLGVITDLGTRVLAEVELMLPDQRPETVVRIGADAAEQLLNTTRVKRSSLMGVGMVLSGPVDAEAGVCPKMPRYGWHNVPLAAMLAEAVSVPVWIDNDANAFAVTQHLFGHGRGLRNIVCVGLGRGVGAGIIINNNVYRGMGGAAGEFGHNFEQYGRLCECGRDGCLETYCSTQGLLQTWRERDPTGCGASSGALLDAADAGDAVARDILADSATRLGRHVAAIVNVLNPELVVFGAEGIVYGEHLFGPLREVLAEVCHVGVPSLALDTELGGTSWPRGAAALAIQHVFNFEATGGRESSNELNEGFQYQVA